LPLFLPLPLSFVFLAVIPEGDLLLPLPLHFWLSSRRDLLFASVFAVALAFVVIPQGSALPLLSANGAATTQPSPTGWVVATKNSKG